MRSISGTWRQNQCPSPSQSPPRSRAGCPSPGPRPVRALRRGPMACLRPAGLPRRWRSGAAGEWVGADAAQEGAQGVHSRRCCGKIAFEFPIRFTATAEQRGYVIRVSVADTDEQAYEEGKHFYWQLGTSFGGPPRHWQAPPGYISREAVPSEAQRDDHREWTTAFRALMLCTAGNEKTRVADPTGKHPADQGPRMAR